MSKKHLDYSEYKELIGDNGVTEWTKYNWLSSSGKHLYTELEYIESTGTQYIDTGIIPDATSEFEVECSQTIGTSQFQSMFGANRTSSGVDDYQQYTSLSGTEVFIRLGGSYGTRPTSSTGNMARIWKLDGTKNVASFHGTTIKVNKTEYTGKSCYGTAKGHLLLFKEQNSDYHQYGVGKIYKFKWWMNNIIVLDLIPVRRKKDGVIGMFDKMNGRFVTNLGTGSFIAGPEKEA